MVRELERSPYFRGIPETVLHPLTVHAELMRASDGTIFAAIGSRPDALYLILAGQVDVLRRPPRGEALQKVSELQPGMLVSHVSVLRDKPRTASYRAN
jgi:CRP-like cAMP-binding protein